MSVIGSIRAFVNTCPFLGEFDALVGVEYLPENTKSFVVEASITDNPIQRRYLNGDTIRRFNFVFASREYFGQDMVENMDVAEFYEKFSDWLEECSAKNTLPDLGSGREARKIQALTNGYVLNADESKARYQIQCQLVYYQESLGGK